MGNIGCLQEKEDQSSYLSSRIIVKGQQDISEQNSNSLSYINNTDSINNKTNMNSRKIQRIKQKYEIPNFIIEESQSQVFNQTTLNEAQLNNYSSLAFCQEGQQKKSCLEILNEITSCYPEGEKIQFNSKITIRHLNSEQFLHSHFRYHNGPLKQQEVVVCSSKAVHSYDYWTLESSNSQYMQLQNTNKIWQTQEEILSQLNQKKSDDETMQQEAKSKQIHGLMPFNGNTKLSATEQQVSCQIKNEDANILLSTQSSLTSLEQNEYFIKRDDEIIIHHSITSKQLTQNSPKVYCDELANNFDSRKKYNWKVISFNQDGYLRENSIVKIVHVESNLPMKINKTSGILPKSIQVAMGNSPYQEIENNCFNDFWILNRVSEV